jgi:parallel beta-helix repeat protein
MGKSFAFCMLVALIALFLIPGCNSSDGESERGFLGNENNGGGGGGGGGGGSGNHTSCGTSLSENGVLTSAIYCGLTDEEFAIEIASSGVTFDCQGHTIYLAEDKDIKGILARGVDDITIKNCRIEGGTTGISLMDVQGGRVTGNRIFETENFGILGDDLNGFTIDGNEVKNTANLINCIEIFDSKDGAISENEVSGCGSAIDLYGSRDISIKGNKVFNIGDTGLGFFDNNDAVTSDVIIEGNDVSECGNIGAVEIMWGSHHLTFKENDFHDSANGIQVYDGNPSMMHDLVVESNQFRGNGTGILVLGDTYTISVRGNEFSGNDTALVFENATDIEIYENTIDSGEEGRKNNAEMLGLSLVEDVLFNHNLISGYEVFLSSISGQSVDLSENYWDGCPQLSRFGGEADQILPLINPINPLPCFYNSSPIEMIDENEDGVDDFNCEREGENECIE